MVQTTINKSKYRILLIRFSSIGDIILTTPLIRVIKTNYPDAVLDYLTLSEYSALLKDNPLIDNLFFHERDKGILYAARNALYLNKNGYDFIFDLHRSIRSLIYRSIIRAKTKNVLKKNYIKRFLLITFKLRLYKNPYTIVKRYFNTANPLKITGNGRAEIWINRRELNEALFKINRALKTDCELKSGNKLVKIKRYIIKGARQRMVCIMPFAKWETKEWGDDRFAELGRRIVSGAGIMVCILGGSGDKARAEYIAHAIGKGAFSFAGSLSLLETSVLLSMSACLVTNDTGIMHMAGAVSSPVVAIFGSTTEELGFFPYESEREVVQAELGCRPCTAKGLRECPKKHFKCMNDITVDKVYSAVNRYI